MPEITFIVDPSSGALAIENNRDLSAAFDSLRENLGEAQEIACARPLETLEPPVAFSEKECVDAAVRIAGFYHNSLTEGPGRRSSVLFQFCPLKCPGCYVPHLHSKNAGRLIPAKKLAALLLDPNFERDGVTVLGGEPFAQADGLLALVKELRRRNCTHIVCYSGYTLEILQEKSVRQPAIGAVLSEIDVLIDGAYDKTLAHGAGLWTGSGNQRVIDMRATTEAGKLVLYRS